MRRTLLGLASLGATLGAVALAVQFSGMSIAVGNGDAAIPAGAGRPMLPVQQVVLFSSGVGYFQREGEVEGDAKVDLSFRVDDINDLLKSMILNDLAGGHINAVSYDSRDPVEKTLRSFAIDLTNNPSFGQLLGQTRGEEVTVSLEPGVDPGQIKGNIVGLEKQMIPTEKGSPVEKEFVTIFTPSGLRSIDLSHIANISFSNPVIQSELKRALEVLAQSHDTQKKTVTLNCTGQGKRPIRVGYIVESPIWKTSYRLVLDDEDKPFMQGWAMVENTSDEDWNNVRMALVSGRPISFKMDLYQPLYVPRPTVEPELFASLRPRVYGGDLEQQDEAAPPSAPRESNQRFNKADRRGRATFDQAGKAMNGAAVRPMVRTEAVFEDKVQLGSSVASAATGKDLGEYFQYVIDRPVTLPRQKSAMLPIVNQSVDGQKVSIYNQSTHAKFPLLGFKLKNSTGQHLLQGPITVFEAGSYAGDSRIMDLQPNEERLISYAVDLGVEVEPSAKGGPQRLTAVKIIRGILHATRKLRSTYEYTIKNRSDNDRDLLIEHPYQAGWNLVTPEKPAERTREVYRFKVAAAAGKSVKYTVTQERDETSTVSLNNFDDRSIQVYLNSRTVSDEVKQALGRAVELKNKLAQTQRQIKDVNDKLTGITRDQDRIRQNLKAVPATSAAYKRYLEKFDSQETEIEALQSSLKTLNQQAEQQMKAFEGYISELNVT